MKPLKTHSNITYASFIMSIYIYTHIYIHIHNIKKRVNERKGDHIAVRKSFNLTDHKAQLSLLHFHEYMDNPHTLKYAGLKYIYISIYIYIETTVGA